MKPAEVFPVHVFIQDEMTARGWSREDVCSIAYDMPIGRLNAILAGERITFRDADHLGMAFCCPPRLFLTLQKQYLDANSGVQQS